VDNPILSISEQCRLIELPRSSFYYQPVQTVDHYMLQLMALIDEEFTRHPHLGTRTMRQYLRSIGHTVNRKRVQHLYCLMGLEAIYPKPDLSKPNKAHKIYPYLLRGVPITACNQVWSTDITYIRLQNGFAYLMAIIDWYSRYVLDWQLSTTLEADFCVETLSRTLQQYESGCEIFNTDQGSQFTSSDFTDVLKDHYIQISMDGRGRALDNIFIERLWRSVKYECIYLKEFATVAQVRAALHEYFKYYNNARFHQSLNYNTPAQVYFSGV
jgi:putative transposase